MSNIYMLSSLSAAHFPSGPSRVLELQRYLPVAPLPESIGDLLIFVCEI